MNINENVNVSPPLRWFRSVLLETSGISKKRSSCPQNGTRTQEEYVFADSSPLGGFAAWGPGQGPPSGTNNSSCVELLNTGSWGPAACHLAMFYICEFPKTRRRVGAAG